MKKGKTLPVICVFLSIIFAFAIIGAVKKDSDFSEKENRALTVRPELTFDDLLDGTFQESYSEYLSDQFVLRDKWVTAETGIMKLIGKKDINSIYIGSDGYLLEKYQSSDFDEDITENNITLLSDFLNDMSSENYKSVSCIFVPSKASVMMNKMPMGISAYSTDYIVDGVKESCGGNVNFIYEKNALAAHNDEYIYYKTDHHWTTLGAYYAYADYAESVGLNADLKDLPELKAVCSSFKGSDYDKLQTGSATDTIYSFDVAEALTVGYNGERENSNSLYDFSCLEEKDKYAYFLGGNFEKINIKTSAKTGRKLLLIKDSFANSFVPYLCDDFSEIVMVDLRYSQESVYSVIENEKGITDVLVLYNTEKFAQDRNQWLLSK